VALLLVAIDGAGRDQASEKLERYQREEDAKLEPQVARPN
jgi:hypothetical protein